MDKKVSDKNSTFSDKWNYRFMEIALYISMWSKDPNTKVGCVVVGPDKEIRSQGYNGFPRGVNDDIEERHYRPLKYAFYEHSERNAIYNAGRFGASLKGCVLYVTMPPCADCARAIIQSGIKQVYYLEPSPEKARTLPNGNWRDTVHCSFEMFNETGVKYEELNRDLVYENMRLATLKLHQNANDNNTKTR